MYILNILLIYVCCCPDPCLLEGTEGVPRKLCRK